MKLVDIYTDGACSGNPGPGGWGAYLIYGNHKKKISGYELETTNNRMELTAAIEALKILTKPCKINLYTDSKYLQQGITEWVNNWQKNNWRKSDNKPVKNADLWQAIVKEIKRHEVIWYWIKGHSNNVGNNVADSLAVSACDEAKKNT